MYWRMTGMNEKIRNNIRETEQLIEINKQEIKNLKSKGIENLTIIDFYDLWKLSNINIDLQTKLIKAQKKESDYRYE